MCAWLLTLALTALGQQDPGDHAEGTGDRRRRRLHDHLDLQPERLGDAAIRTRCQSGRPSPHLDDRLRRRRGQDQRGDAPERKPDQLHAQAEPGPGQGRRARPERGSSRSRRDGLRLRRRRAHQQGHAAGRERQRRPAGRRHHLHPGGPHRHGVRDLRGCPATGAAVRVQRPRGAAPHGRSGDERRGLRAGGRAGVRRVRAGDQDPPQARRHALARDTHRLRPGGQPGPGRPAAASGRRSRVPLPLQRAQPPGSADEGSRQRHPHPGIHVRG